MPDLTQAITGAALLPVHAMKMLTQAQMQK
jgi:hypothetical protein